jgi:tRNA wybutosine-synthesizing protein 4
VVGTPELLEMLTGVREKVGLAKPVVFESDRYVQIGCDLRDLKTLQQGLAAAVGDFAECEFIFVAEVSITYMETEGADEVIRWASTVGAGKSSFHPLMLIRH